MPLSRFLPGASSRAPSRFALSLSAALACLLLSACSSTPPAEAPPLAAPVSVEPASSPTAEVQARAIEPASLITAAPLLGNPAPDSYAFREDAKRLAIELARSMTLDPQWVWDALSKAKVKDTAAKLMMPPPAGTPKNWAAYRSRFIEPQRIRAGAQFWRTYEPELQRAENQYGVPAAIIAGVIGVETIYGRNMGGFRVLDALATLSLDFPKGRSDRSPFFQAELGQFLRLCFEQQIEPDSVLGSYAGAIGLPQFMPSSIRRYAVDFDGDGRIDLIGSAPDAIGSVAHFLSEHGWQTGQPVYFDIAPPTETAARAKLLAPDIVPSFLPQEMMDMGATLPPAAQNHPGKLALVLLQNGQDAPTLIAGTQNFYAITRYNQSSYYALAVTQLGEALLKEVFRQNGLNP
ncbi:MAG: lytic murein transglycosylase B [Aquabacterium sp.]